MVEQLRDGRGLVVLFTVLASATGCARNVDYIKERAPARFAELGYESTAYEGYQWGITGGDVWYILKRADSPGVVYSGSLRRWGDELHFYGPRVVSGDLQQLKGAE